MKSPVLFLCACAIALGCSPDDSIELPPVVWEGDNVRVRMDDESIQVCGGTFEGLDRHAALVRDAMLLDWNGKLVEYSIGDADFVGSACQNSTHACAKPTTGHSFTRYPFYQHEVSHSVRFLDPNLRLLSSAVEEGLATLFGGSPEETGTTALNARETFETPQISGAGYYRAGHLMAMLHDDYGPETFRAFELAASRGDEDAAFAETFGVTKIEFAAIAEGNPQCDARQWWQPLLECAGEPILPDPGTGQIVLAGDLQCSGPDVHGPTLGNNMWTSRHFRIDDAVPPFYYELDFPEDTTLEVVACTGGCPQRFFYRGGRWEVGSIAGGLPSLEPGEYFLRLSRPVTEQPGPFKIVF